MLLSGLSAPNQDVLWVMDNDEIVANDARHRDFVKLAGQVWGQCLPHWLRHVRIAATRSDTGSRDLEDLVSLADLAAGAAGHVASSYGRGTSLTRTTLTQPLDHNLPRKARVVWQWMATDTQPLKRLVYCIDRHAEPHKLSVARLVPEAITFPGPIQT
jgi:hypothetical protein